MSDSVSWKSQYPFDSQFLVTDHGRLHFVDEGIGAPVLMVHGNPTWSFYYRHLIDEVSGTHRAIALDHLGCGLSDKPTTPTYTLEFRIQQLCGLIDALQLENATLVAHDWGGAIGVGALLERRSRFQNIVLLNTAAFPPPFFPLRIRVCRVPLLGKLALQGFNMFARAAIRMATTQRGGLPAKVASGLLAPYDNWNNRRAIYEFVKDIPTRETQSTWQRLAAIEEGLSGLTEMRKLLIWGMKDWCFRPECLDRFVRHWPDAGVHNIESAGHYVLEDATDQVVGAIRNFLDSDSR